MKHLIAATLFFGAFSAHASIVGATLNGAKVNAVRVESGWGFISFDKPASLAPCSADRVYLNLDNEAHRVAYSTALAAFMSGKTVSVRADDVPSKVFGACAMYDIYVSQ
ncbi:MAG TPA: hypothetical protein PKD17_00040 [Cellvibrionaceae bacterium]|nr:hypothetical protein [Cellvibrionaceae bacterium]HMW70172.1 hypothetical protein [Cellvibrionaceae bacterium]HNG59323.1 hypothetical protein [Cellvibrionaceae bacterium]